MSSRFSYDSDIPANVLPIIKGHLKKLEWLLPPWCQCCTVYYCDDSHDKVLQSGALASTQSSYEYRNAKIWFYPPFLRQSSQRQKLIAIHEMVHISVSPLNDYAHQEIARLANEDENLNHHMTLLCELNARCESAVQDLAFIIAEKF